MLWCKPSFAKKVDTSLGRLCRAVNRAVNVLAPSPAKKWHVHSHLKLRFLLVDINISHVHKLPLCQTYACMVLCSFNFTVQKPQLTCEKMFTSTEECRLRSSQEMVFKWSPMKLKWILVVAGCRLQYFTNDEKLELTCTDTSRRNSRRLHNCNKSASSYGIQEKGM